MEATEEKTDDAKPKVRPKFAHLVKDEADEAEAEDLDAEVEDEEAGGALAALVDTGDSYDLKSCANDMMSAFQAGDVDALEEALGKLLEKKAK